MQRLGLQKQAVNLSKDKKNRKVVKKRLLVILVFIAAGIALVLVINFFRAKEISANRSGVISDINKLAVVAQQYYKKEELSASAPAYTFTGWSIPAEFKSTENGAYEVTVSAQNVVITGTGTKTGNDGSTKIKVTAIVMPTAITLNINN